MKKTLLPAIPMVRNTNGKQNTIELPPKTYKNFYHGKLHLGLWDGNVMDHSTEDRQVPATQKTIQSNTYKEHFKKHHRNHMED